MVANDLQLASKGRFSLGLGSQIKPHIERRFSMPWSHPAPRMREFVLAMRAIWSAWNDGEKLDFRGEFYTHTLMTPFFSPGPEPVRPAEGDAGGGRRQDDRGRRRGRRRHDPAPVHHRAVRARGDAPGARARVRRRRPDPRRLPGQRARLRRDRHHRRRVGGGTQGHDASRSRSTARRPGTTGCCALHGWGTSATELNQLSQRGEWVAMGELVTDEMLETFAVVAPTRRRRRRHRGPLRRRRSTGSASTPRTPPTPTVWTQLVADLRDAR